MSPLRTIARILEFAGDLDALRYVAAVRKPSISSYRICRAVAGQEGGFRTVLDVGANQGQFALAAAWCFPQAEIFAFEPLPTVVERLSENVKRMQRIHVCPHALGSRDGQIDFYEHSYSHASSALRIDATHRAGLAASSERTKLRVEVKTLDSWSIGQDLKSPLLLKLDVQGFEHEVIKGAERLLGAVDYLVFESSFVSFYEGEKLFPEMHNIVEALGFDLIAPVGVFAPRPYEIVQMDVLYRRRHQ
jgi:FkbM family methyltransferase